MDKKLEFLKRMREEMKKVYTGERSVEEIKELIRQEETGEDTINTEPQKKLRGLEEQETKPQRKIRGLELIED